MLLYRLTGHIKSRIVKFTNSLRCAVHSVHKYVDLIENKHVETINAVHDINYIYYLIFHFSTIYYYSDYYYW